MKFKTANFWQPKPAEMIAALQDGLSKHFSSVDLSFGPCPDLMKMGVASSGICASTALLEFGGEPYAHNPKYRGVSASVDKMLKASSVANAKVFGAAMADATAINGNCGEMISNADPKGENLSRVARVSHERRCVVERYDSFSCGPIANLFISEGKRGEVLRLEVRRRISEEASLTQAMRTSLMPIVRDCRHVGLGGVFKLVGGKIRSHVMPNYECIEPGYYDTAEEKVVREFLQFYEHMGPELLCFCTLWTGDPTGGELNLRPSGEHTHFYHSEDSMQQAGHYHGDVAPDNVHYVGYFSLAERIIRFGDIYEKLGLKP